jgi:hypothetical protein
MNKKHTNPVTLEHARLRQLATRLGKLHLDDPEILDLATSLYQIGCGEDANLVLKVKRGKGQDTGKAEAHYDTQIAIRWIAGRLNPIDNSTPPSKITAISEAAVAFKLDQDNLARACPSEEKLKTLVEFEWDSQRPQLKKPRD